MEIAIHFLCCCIFLYAILLRFYQKHQPQSVTLIQRISNHGWKMRYDSNLVLLESYLIFQFPIGEMIIGFAAWLSSSWGLMLLSVHVPGLLFISFFWLLDDSLCYLLANGKTDQASVVMRRIAKRNRLDLPDDLEIQLKTAIDFKTQKLKTLPDMDNEETLRENIGRIFMYPTLLIRVSNCSFIWISCMFVYFGLSIHAVSLLGNIYLNFIIIAAIELPAYVGCYYILDRLGRRYITGGSLFLGGMACLACGFISKENWIAQLLLSMVGKFGATIAFKAIFIYSAEMFPTTLRSTLLGICSMFGRLASIAVPQLPLLASISPILPSILFGALGLFFCLFICILPETTGCKLPDTLEESLHIASGSKPQM